MEELDILRRKYEAAMQTLGQSTDAIYTLKAQLDIANERIAQLELQANAGSQAEVVESL